MKADKMDIEQIYEMKSNKKDTEKMLDCQQMICKYFKQLLVLFIEVVNFQVHKASDTKQSIETRKGNLIGQVQNLANWVMRFDPKDFVRDSGKAQLDDDLNDFLFKNFTDLVM
jgi:hypothetical protein